jgi:hypothetical protein
MPIDPTDTPVEYGYATEIASLVVGRTFSADSGLILVKSEATKISHTLTVQLCTDDGALYEIVIQPAAK